MTPDLKRLLARCAVGFVVGATILLVLNDCLKRSYDERRVQADIAVGIVSNRISEYYERLPSATNDPVEKAILSLDPIDKVEKVDSPSGPVLVFKPTGRIIHVNTNTSKWRARWKEDEWKRAGFKDSVSVYLKVEHASPRDPDIAFYTFQGECQMMENGQLHPEWVTFDPDESFWPPDNPGKVAPER